MLLAGSAMAEYLETLWTPHSSKGKRFKLDPAAILTIIGDDYHKIHATHLSLRWFELAEPLGEIYKTAIKYSTDKMYLINGSEIS
jgi:hypothetical protein